MAARSERNLAWLTLPVLVWVGLLSVPLAGCVLDRETTLSRAARQRQVQALRVERERAERDRDILVQRTAELRREIVVVQRAAVVAESNLRASRADLQHELAKLVAAERDLQAAKDRGKAIEAELKPLRDLERTLRERGALLEAAKQRKTLLEKELGVAQAAAKKATADLQPKIDALKAKVAEAKKVDQAVSAAKAALEAGGKLLGPPPKKPAPKKK
ncbi:MAG: hypothetical protein NXI31_23215 [bacterium]|nr:hypothetical protein [bacterium]